MQEWLKPISKADYEKLNLGVLFQHQEVVGSAGPADGAAVVAGRREEPGGSGIPRADLPARLPAAAPLLSTGAAPTGPLHPAVARIVEKEPPTPLLWAQFAEAAKAVRANNAPAGTVPLPTKVDIAVRLSMLNDALSRTLKSDGAVLRACDHFVQALFLLGINNIDGLDPEADWGSPSLSNRLKAALLLEMVGNSSSSSSASGGLALERPPSASRLDVASRGTPCFELDDAATVPDLADSEPGAVFIDRATGTRFTRLPFRDLGVLLSAPTSGAKAAANEVSTPFTRLVSLRLGGIPEVQVRDPRVRAAVHSAIQWPGDMPPLLRAEWLRGVPSLRTACASLLSGAAGKPNMAVVQAALAAIQQGFSRVFSWDAEACAQIRAATVAANDFFMCPSPRRSAASAPDHVIASWDEAVAAFDRRIQAAIAGYEWPLDENTAFAGEETRRRLRELSTTGAFSTSFINFLNRDPTGVPSVVGKAPPPRFSGTNIKNNNNNNARRQRFGGTSAALPDSVTAHASAAAGTATGDPSRQRAGSTRDGGAGTEATRARAPCKFFANKGTCTKGDACLYSHDATNGDNTFAP
jgi:hypothetical protein